MFEQVPICETIRRLAADKVLHSRSVVDLRASRAPAWGGESNDLDSPGMSR